MLATIFVVLMILAPEEGGYYVRGNPTAYPMGGSFFLLWLCVAIIGWIMFSGAPGPVPR